MPSIELDGITLNEILDTDKERYATLCSDKDLNKYWGYDVEEDNPDGDPDFYLETAKMEFDEGIAITLAIRECDELVGEATVYAFDYRGTASIAVRVLKDCHSRGIGSRAVKALIELVRTSYGQDVGIVWTHNMMMDERVASYVADVFAAEGGESAGLYMCSLGRNTGGGNGHPTKDAHTQAALTLLDFISTKELLG
jgi:GNAT superfamily N-acetyltransferase